MSVRKTRRERIRRKQRQQRTITVLVVSGVALIIAALLMLPSLRQATVPAGEIIHPQVVERPMANGNAMGDPNAPVVVHEYSDFGCPHCANFASGTALELEKSYIASGQVYFVSHSVGALLGSETSVQLAEAAYCAGAQNKYWPFQDYVFANQALIYVDRNAPADGYIAAIAEAIELDLDAFNACVEERTYRDQVMQDQAEAIKAGINSTPSFLVNGELLVGNLPFADFQAAIERALNGQ